MSVVKERKDKGAGEFSLMPLLLVADYLHNGIEPNISNRGRHRGAQSITKLKALTTSLFLCDKTPRSIANVISNFVLDNHER